MIKQLREAWCGHHHVPGLLRYTCLFPKPLGVQWFFVVYSSHVHACALFVLCLHCISKTPGSKMVLKLKITL